ncbi:cytochrome P450 21 [Stachybotrys elegans]|uniref:Cytochrome P450 21 n=1 Tax=Stachybotrys elegans TaxID=80388 RepID=A0A8K0T0T6_9HYPO|nr:cytochrome P450 21 [Stachybotrys elegans]
MEFQWPPGGIALAAASICIISIRYFLATRRPKNFPPGPPTLPGIGNLHQIPLKQPFLKFTEWSKTYGNILGLKIGSANFVVINDPLLMHEMFSKRGIVYSGRQIGYIADVVMQEHSKIHLLNMPYGPELRRWRTAAMDLFNAQGQKTTKPLLEATSATLSMKMLNTSPGNNLEYLKQWALATPLLAITGQRLVDRGKTFIDRFFKAQTTWLDLLTPGTAPPVDLFPFLKWLPESLAKWKTNAKIVRSYMIEEYSSYLKSAQSIRDKNASAASTKVTCLMAKVLDSEKTEKKDATAPFSDDEAAWFGGVLLDAAVDTTWSTINALILFLAAHPHVQEKVYRELDSLCSDTPPPSHSIGELKYLRACYLESIRLRPAAPTGLARIVVQDDVINGYFIPKGTTVLANVWALQHNPKDYDNPADFVPERYIHHPLGLKDGVSSEGRKASYVFGSGRRMCTGEQFAESAIILAVAKLLWAYEIVPVDTLDLRVDTGFHTGILLGPRAFKVNFMLRDAKKKEGILQDYRETRAHWVEVDT